ncbi:WG repeat-containing protein [Winogradskyella wichelsiae]|uniref:WG repeat-containing protein n=1 Tax=Winogradskyella wichelsiae TaxID=2697007 RepID=UPI003EF5A607
MKKSIVTLVLFTTLFSACNGQTTTKENILYSALDSLSIDEAKELLIQDQRGIALMLSFSSLDIGMDIETSDFDESSETQFEDALITIFPKDSIVNHVKQFIKSQGFQKHIVYPNTDAMLSFSLFDLKNQSLKGHWTKSENTPEITVNKIFFADGSVTNQPGTSFVASRYSQLSAEINSAKYIDSIVAKINYTYPVLEKEELLHKGDDFTFDDGRIELIELAGNTVVISYPNRLQDRIVGIEGIHKNGKPLKERSTNSKTKPTEEMLAYLENTGKVFKTTVKKIEKNKIKTIEELKKQLKKELTPLPLNEQYTYATYTFHGEVDKINVLLQAEISENIDTNIVLKTDEYTPRPSINYFVALDSVTQKKGLLDEKGNWVVGPNYNNVRRINSYYFTADYIENYNQLYWLNTRNNTLNKVDYELDEYEIYNGNLMITEQETNGPEGLVNIETGQMIIPMTYSSVRYSDGMFTTNNGQNKSGLFDKTGKKVIPEIYKYIEIKAGYIYATKDYKAHVSMIDIFTKKGKNITKEKWSDIGEFGKDSLALAILEDAKDDYITTIKKAFINPKGEIVLDVSDYRNVNVFSNGLAAVETKSATNSSSYWSYIDTKGEVVIPCYCQEAGYFQEEYAYVERGDRAFIITKNGKMFKALPDTSYYTTLSIDGNAATYNLYNEETYNYKGELILEEDKD